MSVATHHVEVEIGGRKYVGTYTLQSRIVKLTSEYGSKNTQIGGSTHPVIAKQLLSECVRAYRRENASD